MKVSYKGYELEAYRERSLGGDKLLYWSIFRESDWYECDSGFSTGRDSVRIWIKLLKERVDKELASNNPWNEHKDDSC